MTSRVRPLSFVLVGSLLATSMVAAQTGRFHTADSAPVRDTEASREARETRRGDQSVPEFLSFIMPRVSGLSVSTATTGISGGGYDVDLDIQMTTTRTYNPTWGSTWHFRGVPGSARMGDNQTTFSYGVLSTPIPLSPSDYALIFFSTTPLPNPTTHTYTGFTNALLMNNPATGIYTPARFITYVTAQLPLPAVSFGDGDTSSQLVLTQPTGTQTATTTNGARSVSRRWRASLSHSYPDLSSYTVRVASACCSPDVPVTTSPLRGAASTLGTLNYGYNFQTFVFSGVMDIRTATGDFDRTSGGDITSVNTANTNLFASQTPYQFVGFSSFSNTTFPSVALNQVTASAEARPSVLAIPTSGAFGLAALALLLAGFGILVLRS